MTTQSDPGTVLTAEQDVRPCKHMEGMVNGLADGSLHGPARWYTQLHVMHCAHCKAAVKNLRVVIGKVSALRQDGMASPERLPTDRRVALERAMDEVAASSRDKG